MSRNYHSGESIIEIIIVSFFLITALVAFVSLTMMSVARNRLSKERIVATRMAQEGVEWLRNQRDSQGFDVMEASIAGPRRFCIPTTTGTFPSAVCSGVQCETTCPVTGSTLYSRWAELSSDAAKIQFSVTVNWGNQVISQQGVLNKWEQQ